jgi:hypothetical protein
MDANHGGHAVGVSAHPPLLARETPMPVHYKFDKKPATPVARIEIGAANGMDYFFDVNGVRIGKQPTKLDFGPFHENSGDTLASIRAAHDASQKAPRLK